MRSESFVADIPSFLGRTRLERLYLIGTTSTFLGVEALKLLIREIKEGKDVAFYKDALSALKSIAPNEPEAQRDNEWIDVTNKVNAAETARLEAQLKGYKNNLIKESIRVS